ncbi:hypothetical protein Goklo_027641 [Gossypium klotzschianum]|uniref:Uncharacterized protein n=1 Tax=Gossypium klotzschianum TaxID=34286 RepID=A0A7J8TYV7_9ROSI|nr:hypothetical protein [Gossypium klotzschianum]
MDGQSLSNIVTWKKGIFWFSFWLIVQRLMFSFIIELHVQRSSFWLLRNERADLLELADKLNKPQAINVLQLPRNQEQFLMHGLGAQEVEFVSGVTPKSVSYVMVVKGYNKYYAGIPRCFTEEAGLGKVSMVMIKGPSGMWPMMTTFSSKQVLLSVGWMVQVSA